MLSLRILDLDFDCYVDDRANIVYGETKDEIEAISKHVIERISGNLRDRNKSADVGHIE